MEQDYKLPKDIVVALCLLQELKAKRACNFDMLRGVLSRLEDGSQIKRSLLDEVGKTPFAKMVFTEHP